MWQVCINNLHQHYYKNNRGLLIYRLIYKERSHLYKGVTRVLSSQFNINAVTERYEEQTFSENTIFNKHTTDTRLDTLPWNATQTHDVTEKHIHVGRDEKTSDCSKNHEDKNDGSQQADVIRSLYHEWQYGHFCTTPL